MILPRCHPADPRVDYADVRPEISVVVPVYNAAQTIAATVNSVLAQSFRWFEIVAVDDGSTDGSLNILLELAAQDSRLRVVSKHNGGVSAARNLGVEIAAAPLIAFLDADDLWARDKLDRHIALHRAQPELAATFARIAFIAQNAETLDGAKTVSTIASPVPQLVDVLGENPVCTASNLVVRRDWFIMLGKFDERLRFAEDQEFVARLISRGGKASGIDSVLTGYRFSPDGLSMDHDQMHAGWRILVDRYFDDASIRASLEALYCRYLARRMLRSGGSPLRALTFVLRGLRLDARSFMGEWKRGLATIMAACAAPLIPRAMRRRIFA